MPTEPGLERPGLDADAELCLEQLASVSDSMTQIVAKYAAVTQALEAIDLSASDHPDLDEGSFGYTAVDIPAFLDLMFEVVSCLRDDRTYRDSDFGHLPVTFLDAGCGTGRNLHLVSASGAFERFDARGIEAVADFIDFGERVFGLSGRIERADCLTYDYGPYDIVYFYRPFSDDELEIQFEERVIESLSKGAFVAAPLSLCLEGSHRLTARGDSGQVWKKLR